MAKRSYGEGSVYPTSDGKGWMADLSMMLPNGKRKRIRRRAKNKTEANRLLRSLRDDHNRHGTIPDLQRTVSTAVIDYLGIRKAQGLQPQTMAKDERHAKLIVEGLGRQRLAALTVDECDEFLRAAAAGEFGRPLGKPELRRLRQKLIRVLENYERRGLLNRNVAAFAIVPEESPDRVPRREPRAVHVDEVERLIRTSYHPIDVFIDLVGRNGLRPAEARALRWSRIDFESLTVQVDAQMNRANELVRAKTKRSYRTIRIDQDSIQRLTDWRVKQMSWENAAGPAWSGNAPGLVITTRLGTPVNQRNVHRSLAQTCQRAGVEPAISAYDLRHSAITRQVDVHHPPHKVADWAGTSETMIANVYRHRLELVADLLTSPGDLP